MNGLFKLRWGRHLLKGAQPRNAALESLQVSSTGLTGAQVLFEGDPLILWQRVLDKVREFVAPVPAVHVVVTSAAPGGLRLSALLTELD